MKPLLFRITLLLIPICISFSVVAEEANATYQECGGKVIRSIKVTIRDVFDQDDPSTFYRTVNSAKINTQEQTVRRELLFKEGDTCDPFVVKESARNLRAQRYLRNIKITPQVHGDVVDLEVSAQDTWTFIPSFSYSTGAGTTNQTAGIAETNIGGLGKRVEVFAADEDKRQSIEGVYDDPRLFGSSLRLVGAEFLRNDGNRSVFLLTDPFRTLLDKESWTVDGDISNTVGRLWQNGDERFIYGQKTVDLGARYTWAAGNPEKHLNRYALGYDYQRNNFSEATLEDYNDVNVNPKTVSQDPRLLAEDRLYTGPSLGYESVDPNFIKMNYIDRFDREDDYDLGDNFSLRTTIAPEFLGSLDDALLINGNRSAGVQFSRDSFLRGEFGFSTRATSDNFQNTLLRAESKYYNVLGPLYANNLFLGRHTLAMGYRLNYGRELDKDREFLLGGDNGLRGYEAKTFTGDKLFALNVEDRIHLADDVLKLMSFGVAAFVDAGGTTDGPLGDLVRSDLYGDAGVGLRFAFPRSSGGRVLRVDFAAPFRDGPDGSSGYQIRIIFAGGQIFDSRVQSEIFGQEKANVEVGTDK